MATVGSLLRTDFKTVDKRDPLRSVLGWMSGDTRKVPIVMDADRPVGIVNERAMVRRQLDSKAKLEAFMTPVRPLPLSASLDDAATLMAEHRAPLLPVADERGRLAGYVTAVDVAREREATYSAADLCLPVQTLREGATIGDAIHLFTQEYVSVLPVLGKDGRVAGVLPRSTLVRMETDMGDKGRKDAGGEKVHVLDDEVDGFMENTAIVLPAAAKFHEVLDKLEDFGYAIVQRPDGAMLGLVTPETLMRRV